MQLYTAALLINDFQKKMRLVSSVNTWELKPYIASLLNVSYISVAAPERNSCALSVVLYVESTLGSISHALRFNYARKRKKKQCNDARAIALLSLNITTNHNVSEKINGKIYTLLTAQCRLLYLTKMSIKETRSGTEATSLLLRSRERRRRL